VVSWAWETANVHDQVFLPLVAALEDESIVLADTGFNDADGIPANLKWCEPGTWNERVLVETALSLVTMVCHLTKVFHRTRPYFQARLAYVVAIQRCPWSQPLSSARCRPPGSALPFRPVRFMN
jgi:hypothetical protein